MSERDPWAELAKAQHDLKVAVWDDDLRPRFEHLLAWLSSGRAGLRQGLFFGFWCATVALIVVVGR